ncbi:hypothetical protein MVES_000886 [Malassezia vespertilionis]|uniref:RNA-binding protein VTS1 n=1 Tax=Malassezia vespertilionis TaxID=2020962 RepID=A0A2N1JF46_9BASI|nr:hypothetical protein MVES_000886 [Malassezia vespertilionis]
MRASFSPSSQGRSPSPAQPEQRQRPPSTPMTNPLRYSHGKMGLPNEGIMRIPQSQDANRSMSNAQAQTLSAARNLRPSSEMLNAAQQATPEMIDKWFEDLQNYEATLEEMAAASLDQNFKEELSAIEQWFRVLSEAERTAALYSLLQESTQVQIRFFITVLQQMARSDPVGAFLSPNTANNIVGEQLEAKMASLGIKTPSSVKSPSTNTRGFQRQSTGFLSPNAASLYSGSPDVASALAAQRSKMKSNRTSAPGTIPMESVGYSGSKLDDVQEKATPARERPRSSDLGVNRTPHASGPLDDALSPLGVGGSWSSMVNTPIMSMLDESQVQDTNAKLDATAANLAQISQNMANESDPRARRASANQPSMFGNVYEQGNWNASPQNLMSPQFNNFSIPTMSPNTLAGLQSPSGGMSNPANVQMMNTMATVGGLNNLNPAQLLALQQQILLQQHNLSSLGSQARMARGQRSAMSGLAGAAATPSRSTNTSSALSKNPVGSPVSTQAQAPEEEVADISILNDVPAWLRHLRLHKYTPNFEGSNWREMVSMDERALEEKGVAALGARRKMLKTFEAVRHKYGIPAPAGASAHSDAGESERGDQA